MLKKYIFGLLFLSAIDAFADDVRGVVVDERMECLPYSTVRVKHKRIGVLCDSLGRFVLPLKGVGESDTLSISYLGYKTKYIPVADAASGEGIRVGLTPDKTVLREVAVVSGKKHKRTIKGKRHGSGMLRSFLDGDMAGECFGYEFHAKKNKKLILEKVGFFYCEGDSMLTRMKFRVNVYDMTRVHKSPTRNFVNILSEPIFVDFLLADTAGGRFEYVLPEPVVLPEDAMVEIEILENFGGKKLWYMSNLIGKKVWCRSLVSGYWIKEPFAEPFFVECIETESK